ncbi:MAG: hypothetical protein ACHQET_07020 [Chitinophagales bacterium]
MNTTNDPINYPEYRPEKRDSRNAIILILAIAFLGILVYAVYSGSHHHSIQQSQQATIGKVTDEKDALRKNFDDALVRLDSVGSISNKIRNDLSDKEKDVSKLKANIRNMLAKEHLSQSEMKKAQELITDLNQKISSMEEEVTRLTQDNQNLTADKTKLTQDNQQLTSDLQVTTATKDSLANKADIASTFNASNIAITPMQVKSSGQEKETTNAKKVAELNLSFDLNNRIATSGQVDIYVCVTGPDGKLISSAEMGSGEFKTRDEADKKFTTKVPVDFEAGKVKHVQYAWKNAGGFQKGVYMIEIYHNGFKIGEATRELKKGGLFS